MARQYAHPLAFKQALEQRLKTAASSGIELGRQRQLLVFDRFLARVQKVIGDAVTLKGGLVLEVRLAKARTTKDIDLRLAGSPEGLMERLTEAARLDLGDFMRFEIQPDPKHPEIQNEGLQYDGYRFRAECRLAGKIYGQAFGVDVVFGGPMLGEPDLAAAADLLDFIGVPPPTLRLYPIATHIAEKLHAYTLPREKPNSRVKDLPDLALLATTGPLNAETLRTAIDQTFSHRATHVVPHAVPEPPATWDPIYREIAKKNDLPWANVDEVYRAVTDLLDPVLRDDDIKDWAPDRWRWEPTAGAATSS